MLSSLKFPDPRATARKQAEEFQRLSPDARWRELAALAAFGWAMVRSSPDPAAVEKRLEEQEAHWQQIQRDLFARYGG